MTVKVHEKLYIGGEWVDPATDAVIDIGPALPSPRSLAGEAQFSLVS
jgi:hypothetical protein